MKDHEIIRLLDGEGWMEYLGNLYEYIGDQDGKHLFQNINDLLDSLTVSDKALRHSTEFYFTEKF